MNTLEASYERLDGIRAYLYEQIIGTPTSSAAATAASSYSIPYSNVGHLLQKDRHDPFCGVRLMGFKTPCSCCKGALTFCKAQRFVNTLVGPQLRTEETPVRAINNINPTTGIGLNNLSAIALKLRGAPQLDLHPSCLSVH